MGYLRKMRRTPTPLYILHINPLSRNHGSAPEAIEDFCAHAIQLPKFSCVGPIYVHVGYNLHTEIFAFVLLPFRPWTPVFALLEHKYIDKKVRGSLYRFNYMYKKFRELLPVLTSRHLSYKTRGHVYSSCVRSAMLHASETWPLTKTNLQRLQRNDRAMIRQICSIKPEDVARVRSSELLAKLQLEDLDLILRERRLRWFGHVARSSGAIRTAYDMQIDGRREAGRPKQTWKKLTEKDCREWKLTTVDPQERSTWRSGVRSAMRAASQLPGKGPTDVDDAPAPAR